MQKLYTKDRKISYYASSLSDNILETPEGYLICKNVPIARTGVQEYLGQELGINDKYDEYIKIYREPEEVFSAEAISSFEGKPFTDDHPAVMVDINNINQYDKGHVQNVRRSSENPTLLVADIIVKDAQTISEIKNKVKREISCGYDCYYVPYKDGYKQMEILGNHIALVTKGRAGSHVSIQDKQLERKEKMAKKSNILAAMLKAFAKDAEPEEVAEAMEAINKKEKVDDEEVKVEEKKAEEEVKDEDPLADLAARLDAMEAKIEKLFSAEKEEGHEELEDGGIEEEILSKDEDEIGGEETMVISKDSFDSLKSAVARIGNAKDRKVISDALRTLVGKKASTGNVYDSIVKISQKTKDSAKITQQISTLIWAVKLQKNLTHIIWRINK